MRLPAAPEENRPWLVRGRRPRPADLEALTKELLTDRVRFVGMVGPDEVPWWYRKGYLGLPPDHWSDLLRQGGLRSAGALSWTPAWMAWWKTASTAGKEGRSRVCTALNTIISDPPLWAAAPERSGHRRPLLAEHFAQVLDAYQQATLKQYESEHVILSWV